MPVEPTETLRDTCFKVLHEGLGKEVEHFFMNNAPVGYYKYYYETEALQEHYKAEANKVFFMRVRYFHGGVTSGPDFTFADHLWVTRDEMPQYFSKNYYDRVINFLWPDPK